MSHKLLAVDGLMLACELFVCEVWWDADAGRLLREHICRCLSRLCYSRSVSQVTYRYYLASSVITPWRSVCGLSRWSSLSRSDGSVCRRCWSARW